MKVFLTDRFLNEVYGFLQETGIALNSLLEYPTMRNSLPGPKNPIFEKYKREKGRREFSKIIYNLKKRGYIRASSLKGVRGVTLTSNGIDRAVKASFKMERRRRKDGKWVMMTFDIPEKKRILRDILREALRSLGFKIFQQSVWVSPYDVSEKIEKFVQMHNMENYVKIFLIEEIS